MRKKYVYTYTSCKLEDIYTRMHIYSVLVCVCIHIMCIYAFLRGVRQVVRRKGNLHFGFSCCAFLGNLTSLRRRNLFRSSDPKRRKLSRSRRESFENKKGKTSKRDQFKIVRADTLGAFFSNVTTIPTKNAYR